MSLMWMTFLSVPCQKHILILRKEAWILLLYAFLFLFAAVYQSSIRWWSRFASAGMTRGDSDKKT